MGSTDFDPSTVGGFVVIQFLIFQFFELQTNPLTNLKYSAEKEFSEIVSIVEHMEIRYFNICIENGPN